MSIPADRNRARLHEIMSTLGRPGYVKEAAAVDFSDLDRIPSSSFADPETRQYPCHTKEACWVSAAYMAHDGVTGEPIKRLEKFAASWGIGSDVQMTFAKVEIRKGLEKQAAEKIAYALDETYDGKPVRRFPIATAEMVKTSADRFYADRAKYPWAWRTKVAAALRQKIAEHKIEKWIDEPVRDYLDRAAGAGTLDKTAMWYELATAQHHMPKDAAVEKLAQIVEGIEDLLEKGHKESDLVKTACQVFATIHEAGLREFVSHLPEERLIGRTVTKLAAERANYVVLGDGSTIDVRTVDFEKVAAAVPALADVTPETFADRVRGLDAKTSEVLRLVVTG